MKGAAEAVPKAGEPGGEWKIVRRNVVGLGFAAVAWSIGAWLIGAGSAMAGDPIPSPGLRIVHMQTAFNPNLPGAGEAVRTFAKTIKHMSDGGLAIKMIEPGRVAPTPDMLDAVVAGDLEAGFTWSGYAAPKAQVLSLFANLPFGPGPEDMTSWLLEGDGGRIHREAYDRLGVTGIPCGVQGPKGGGWFRSDLNTVADFKGTRLRYGRISSDVVARLGLPYYMPGWQQPSSVLDFLMRKDKWEALPAAQRAQIETACRANIAWTLSRSPHTQAVALEKLRASGVVIKNWAPGLLLAFRQNTDIVLKDRADHDPEFAAAWANQKSFVAQGATWRTLSRLP